MHPLVSSWFCISCSTSSSLIFSPLVKSKSQTNQGGKCQERFPASSLKHLLVVCECYSTHPVLPEHAWVLPPWLCHCPPCRTPSDPPQSPHTFHGLWPCRCVGARGGTAQSPASLSACLQKYNHIFIYCIYGFEQGWVYRWIWMSHYCGCCIVSLMCLPSALGFPRTYMISAFVGFWPKALTRSPHWA